MARDITVTFDDGSSHVYENAPDNITFDQALARAQSDFSDRGISNIDGGRKAKEPTEGAAQTMGRGIAEMRGYGRPAPKTSATGEPVNPKGKSVFERVPLEELPEPVVDYQKNLETMERSSVPESVMFTPGRTLQQVNKQIEGYEKKKTAAAEKAAAVAKQRQEDLEEQVRQSEEAGGYGFGDAMQDASIGLLGKGSVMLGQSAVGLANLATGWIPEDERVNPLQLGNWNKMFQKLEEVGLKYDPESANQFLTGLQSPQMQVQLGNVERAKGFFNTLEALAVNPLALMDSITTSLPSMLGAGAAGGATLRLWVTKAAAEAEARGLTGMAAQKFISSRVQNAAVLTGHAAEGILTAGSLAEQAREQGVDWSDYVMPAISAGVGTAAIGYGAGKVASKFGIGDIETDIAARAAGLKTNLGVGDTKLGLARYVFGEMAKEGLLEEMPQSAQEQIWTNLATGRPWNEGVPEASAQGLAAGAGMGGGHAVLNRALQRTAELVQTGAQNLQTSIARDGLPMTPEELARSKGFLGGTKEQKQQRTESAISNLEAFGKEQDDLDLQRDAAGQTEADIEAAAERAAIQNEAPVATAEDIDDVPDIFGGAPSTTTTPTAQPAAGKQQTSLEDQYRNLSSEQLVGIYEDYLSSPEEYEAAKAELDRRGEYAPMRIAQIGQILKNPNLSEETRTQFQAELGKLQGEPKAPATQTTAETPDQYRTNLAGDIAAEDVNYKGETTPAETPATTKSTALVPVTPEIKDENHPAGVDLDDFLDPEDPTGLWSGVTYYAGTPEVIGSGASRRASYPVSVLPINSLEEAKDAEANGKAIYTLNKPAQKTVPELEQEIAKLKGQRNKLLTPTGKEPKPTSKNGQKWAVLTRQMDDLWGQISALESGRLQPATPTAPAPTTPQLTNEPYTIDVEARVVDETVKPQLENLSPLEIQKLQSHYGLQFGSEKFIARVKEDIVRFANEGAAAVAGAIRDIIKKLHAGVLSMAIIFNPTNISVPEFLVYPPATTTHTEQVLAQLPEGTEQLSDSGKQAYQTLYPVVKERVQRDNKLFTLVDKPTGHTYIFGPDGKVILRTKTLLGKAFGDFYKGNNNLPQNRITPAGFFTFGLRDATRSADEAKTAGEYDYGKVFVLDKVIAGQYSMTIFHSAWLHESDAAMRARALASDDQTDSRYSFGCVNVNKQTYGYLVNNHLQQMDGSPVFIVPDNPANLADLLSGKPENRDGLERETFTPPTQEVVEEAESAQADPTQVAAMEADRRKNIFKSIVQTAVNSATSVPIEIADFIKTNMAGVAKLVKLFQDGKMSAEDFAAQMLRFQERVERQKEIKRNETNQRMRGFGRVVKALEDAKKAGRISPETADFAIWFLSKNPALASNLGIKIALPKNKKVAEEQEGTAGFYVAFEELVRIITRKDPETGQYYATKSDTAVHEILHHLERMLPDDIRHAIRKEWAKQITAEMKKAKAENNTNKVNYLALVLYANATNDAAAYKAAERMIVDGEVPQAMYTYFNPSEFWAVRGSGLLAGRYGANTRFAKAKQWLREFAQTLRRIFGFSNDHAIIKGLEAVIRGDGTFVSNEMLAGGDYEVPAKQVTPKGLHPDVAAAINRNDISGALRALARNTSGLYSVLAARLAELDLPTSIAFDNARELIRQNIDNKTAEAQGQMFTIIRRAYPALYNKYFSQYDKPESLENVYAGLKELEKNKYDTSLFSMQLAAIREAYDDAMPGLNRSGMYVPSLDAISLSTKSPFGLRNQVLLHEVVHAATEYMIRNTRNLTDRQLQAVTSLYTMYNYAKEALGGKDYGFTDIYEFVAEALTNKAFQDKLRTLWYPPSKASTLNAFINFVLRMFGVNNVARAAMVEANEIFSAKRDDSSPSSKLRFGPPVKGRKGRYKKGPLTSRWRTAEGGVRRFSNMLKDAITSIPEAGKVGHILQRASKYNVRQAMLPWLNLRMIKEQTAHTIPYIGAAIQIVTDMQTYRGELLSKALTVLEKWSLLQGGNPQQSRLMSLIMLEATIQGTEVDPQGPGYIDPLTAKPEDKVAPQALVDAWNALEPEFQKLYGEVRDYYTNMLKETIDTMKARIDDSAKTDDEKKALKAEIDRQFTSIGQNRPYFPLRRFGDYWFQVTANGRSEFYTFESMKDRDAAYMQRHEELAAKKDPRLQEAARSMRSGNSISELYSQNRDVAGALKDVNELIKNISDTITVKSGASVTTRQKTIDEVKNEMRDTVDQLVYVLLPQQSMKKMFVNRRAVQGASEDMLRVFAETSMRSAYQQSRFKYMQPYMNTMVRAREYVDEYVKGLAQADAKDYIDEVEKRFRYTFGVEDKSKWARLVAGVQQYMFLNNLTTIASALMNVIAYPIMAERTIGGRYGVAKANKVLAKNFALYFASAPSRTFGPMANGEFSDVQFPSIMESGKFTGVLAKAAKFFLDAGDVNASQASDVSGYTGKPSEFTTNRGEKIMQVVTAPFHQMDRLTREVTLMSVFELAYEKYLGADKRDARGIVIRNPATGQPLQYTDQEAFDKAIEEARDAAAASVGEYVRALKARVFSSPTGALMLQFKQVAVTIMYAIFRDMWLAFGAPLSKAERNMLKDALEQHYASDPNRNAMIARDLKEYDENQKSIYKEAFRKVVLLNVTAMLMAGAEGTPVYFLASIIPAIARMFAPDGDEWDDFETWFYNMLMSDFSGAVTALAHGAGASDELAQKIGVKTAHAVARGVPAAALNWSLTERIGVNPSSMMFRDTRFYPDGVQEAQAFFVNQLGPAVGYLVNTIPEAAQLYQQGHLERAFERLFNAPAKPFVAARYAEEGVKKKTGEVVVHKSQLNEWDIASQAIGIQPEHVAMAQRQGSNNSEKELRLMSRQNALLQKIWAEHIKRSPGEMAARKEFYEFAARHPNRVPDPEQTINDSFENHEKKIIESAGTFGAKVPENSLLEIGKAQSGVKKYMQNR